MIQRALVTTRVRPLAMALAVALLVLLAMTSSAQAQIPDYSGCVSDFQAGANCTANDVTVGSLEVFQTLETCASGDPGEYGTYIFKATLVGGSDERYDIGFYIALDGLSAQDASRLPNGASCYHDYLTPASATPNPTNPAGTGPFLNAEVGGDTCGDIAQGVTNIYLTNAITLKCSDFNPADGIVDPISTCVSWDNQKNGSPICTSVAGAVPNTKSKCKCESISIPSAVIRKIVVDKVTVPSGDPQSFDFTLKAPGGATLNTFPLKDTDPVFISAALPAANGYSVVETLPAGWELASVTCTNGIDNNIDPSNIPLTLNREVRCTFNNRSAEIKVTKLLVDQNNQPLDPATVGTVFRFGVDAASETWNPANLYLSGGETGTFKVTPGTYTVSELSSFVNDPGDWTLFAASCDNGTWTGYPSIDVTGVVAGAGDIVNCTFTNKIGSTAVSIASFTAAAAPEGVTLAWETVSETGNAGFNVYRSTSDAGPWTKVNATLIPAAAPGSSQGHAYTWTDASAEAGSTYFYQLEDVALSGATTVHAPVSVTLVGPNAVGLNSLSATTASRTGMWTVLLLGLVAAGLIWFKRQ